MILICISVISALDVLPEQDLYELALFEDDKALYLHYLENYRDVDQRRTVTILYNYMKISGLTDQNAESFLSEGIKRTLDTSDVFVIQRGRGLFVKESSLYFFWQMASLFEINNEYEKAKKMYEILGDLFAKHQLQYSWIAENSIKEINGKIYKMNLYLDE
jgi:hypothetical protein